MSAVHPSSPVASTPGDHLAGGLTGHIAVPWPLSSAHRRSGRPPARPCKTAHLAAEHGAPAATAATTTMAGLMFGRTPPPHARPDAAALPSARATHHSRLPPPLPLSPPHARSAVAATRTRAHAPITHPHRPRLSPAVNSHGREEGKEGEEGEEGEGGG